MGWRVGTVIRQSGDHLVVHCGDTRLEGRTEPHRRPWRKGTAVLVEVADGCIVRVQQLTLSSTTFPSIETLLKGHTGRRAMNQPRASSSGEYAVDSKGRACELCWITEDIEPNATPQRIRLLNLSGYKLSHLHLPALQVHACEVDGQAWLVIPPTLQERAIRPPPKPRPPPERTPPPPPAKPVETWLPRPLRRPLVPASLHIDFRCAAKDVVWHDGTIEATVPKVGSVRLNLETARSGLEDLKTYLDFRPPLTLRIHGTIPPSMHAADHLTVTPSVPIERAFELAGERRLVHTADSSSEWSPLSTISSWAGHKAGTGLRLITSERFGMHQRKEAFGRLYQHKAESLQPVVWKRTMVLFPIQLRTWARHVWVCETPMPDRASYIFAPDSPDVLAHLKATLSDPNFRRQAFLANERARTSTGFVGRTFHRGSTDAWWMALCRKARTALP